MFDQTDSRQITRMGEPDEISYKFPDTGQSYFGVCLKLSGSDILFRAERFIETGKALEVIINRKSVLSSSMIAYVEVIRSNEVEPGVYEVATEIKGVKEK